MKIVLKFIMLLCFASGSQAIELDVVSRNGVPLEPLGRSIITIEEGVCNVYYYRDGVISTFGENVYFGGVFAGAIESQFMIDGGSILVKIDELGFVAPNFEDAKKFPYESLSKDRINEVVEEKVGTIIQRTSFDFSYFSHDEDDSLFIGCAMNAILIRGNKIYCNGRLIASIADLESDWILVIHDDKITVKTNPREAK